MSGATRDRSWSYKISLLLGSATLLLDALVLVWWGEFDGKIFIGLLLGLACVANSFWQYIGATKELRDERMLRVSTYATTLAWFCTVIILICAAIVAYYLPVEYNGAQAMGFALFVCITSMLAWLAYYSTKGDLELPDYG